VRRRARPCPDDLVGLSAAALVNITSGDLRHSQCPGP
jgi:hypothetical protein